MQPYLALTGALPALLVMYYVDRLDAKRPEPRWTLRKVALAGALSVIPVFFIELGLMAIGPQPPSYANAVWTGVFVAGTVEELAKVLCVWWFVWHKPEFDERLDGIVYATRAGLGFAMVENVLHLSMVPTEDFLRLFILRAILTVPGHAIWAGMMGYYAARKRFDNIGPGLAGGFLLAVAQHGAFDAAIFVGPSLENDGYGYIADVLVVVPIAIIAAGAVVLRQMARNALRADDIAEASAGKKTK